MGYYIDLYLKTGATLYPYVQVRLQVLSTRPTRPSVRRPSRLPPFGSGDGLASPAPGAAPKRSGASGAEPVGGVN